jgi:hypothetical protein
MDPNSSYYLEIKMVRNPRCRKEISCFIWDDIVDSDICNFKDFVDGVVAKYPPGYGEHVTVAYYDHASKTYLEVKSDQEFLAMFAEHVDKRIVSIAFSYNLPNETPEWPTVSNSQSTQPTAS